MRILHFLWSLNTGGAEYLAVDLANHQSRQHEVTLFVGNDSIDPVVRAQLDPAVRLIAMRRPEGSKNPYWIARLVWTLYRLRPDVIHSHARDLARLAKFIFRPMVLTVHDMHQDLSKVAEKYAQICCISEAVYADIHLRYPTLNPCRVDNGIDISKIAKAPRRNPSRQFRGVQVSRLLHEKKGQDLLIRALAAVNANHASPVLILDFIGDGPSHHYLIELAEELGVNGQCNFLGACTREDIYKCLFSYDFLIQPSRYEGFGLTVSEGMAAGIPVLVSNIDGPMEIIGKGLYGYFFANDDVDSLVQSLLILLNEIENNETRGKVENAFEFVKANYGLQRTSHEYCKIYETVFKTHCITNK